MVLVYLSLFVIIPAIFIIWIWELLAGDTQANETRRAWSLFPLLVAIGVLLPGAFFAPRFADGNFPLFLPLIFPTLAGVLALLMVRWREVLAQWRRQKTLLSFLLIVLLLLVASLGFHPGTLYAPLVILLPAALAALLWALFSRFKEGALVLLAFAATAYLVLDASGLLASQRVMGTTWMRAAYELTGALARIVGLAISAILIQHSFSSRQAISLLTTAALPLLGLAASEVRHGLLVNATSRGAEDHMPFASVMIAVLAGMLLAGVNKGRARLAGFVYMVLVPILVMGAYSAGWLFDPHGITEGRAGRFARAIERYKTDTGEYPPSLEKLTPRYMTFLPGPLNGRGRNWCYDSGQDYYRLGYIYFQRYYEATIPTPYYEFKVLQRAGTPPPGDWVCDQELARYKESPGL